jgi:hypothetical protein
MDNVSRSVFLFTTKSIARQSRNQRRKDNFHHEGTKDTKEEFSRKDSKHVLSNVEGAAKVGEEW